MPLKTHIDDEPTLNLTAMLDVLFLLIIFFMLGTRFVDDERKIGLSVPKVVDKGSLTAAPSRCVVNVYLDGTIALDQSPSLSKNSPPNWPPHDANTATSACWSAATGTTNINEWSRS